MEELLNKYNSDQISLFYRIQIKAIEVSQVLQIQGSRLSENQVKNITNQNINVFAMTEKLFSQAGISHLYQLIRQLCLNYSSIIVLLAQRVEREQKKALNMKRVDTLGTGREEKEEEKQGERQKGDGAKAKRMGGVHLYNQSYSRYVQDHRVLQQIQLQRQQHSRKKKQEILDSIVVQQLMVNNQSNDDHQGDQIAQFIMESRNKKSSFSNYTSFEPELNDIMDFFQHAQTEAKEFLAKKGRSQNKKLTEVNFSFSDFEIDIIQRQKQFKNEIIEKVKIFMEKIRQRERQIQVYLQQKQTRYQQMSLKFSGGRERETQTDFNFSEYLKRNQQQKRELQIHCSALQSQKGRQNILIESQIALKSELAIKQKEVEKIYMQKKELEQGLVGPRRVLRQEKSRKFIPSREEGAKSLRIIDERQEGKEEGQTDMNENKSKKHLDVSGPQLINQGSLRMISTGRSRQNLGQYWNRKVSQTGSEFFDATDRDRQHENQKQESNTKHYEKKKFSMYNLNPKYDARIIRDSGIKGILRQFSVQCSIQTDQDIGNERTMELLTSLNNKISNRYSEEDSQSGRSIVPNHLAESSRQDQKSKDGSLKKRTSSSSKDRAQLTSSKKRSSDSRKKQEMPIKRNSKLAKQAKVQALPMGRTKSKQRQISKEEELNLQQKKAKTTYRMFDVVEQRQEQMQSMMNTQRSLLIQKRQAALTNSITTKSIEAITPYCLRMLYSFTIYPIKQKSQKRVSVGTSKGYQQKTTVPSMHEESKEDRGPRMIKKHFRAATEAALATFKIEESDGVNKLLESMDRLTGGTQNKKIQNWKKEILDSHKADLMTPEVVQNIMNVLKTQQRRGSSSSVTTPDNRNSLPQISPKQLIQHYPMHKKQRQAVQSLCQIADMNQKIDLQEDKMIDELIRTSSLDSNFATKFTQLHKKCNEGPMCSHITRFFDAVIKQIQEVKQKQRQSLNMHIEYIGRPFNKMEELFAKKHKSPVNSYSSSKFSSKENSIYVQEQSSMNKYTRQSLQKVRMNKQAGLPAIKQDKGFMNK